MKGKRTSEGAPSRLRLISRSGLMKGLVKTASISDGVVDIAAAAEMGLIEDAGILRLLPAETRARARRLLATNLIRLVKLKASTVTGKHLTKIQREMIEDALPYVIGPMYIQEQQNKGVSLARALDRRKVVTWIMSQMESGNSDLNKQLNQRGYTEVCGLKRGRQWWERILQ